MGACGPVSCIALVVAGPHRVLHIVVDVRRENLALTAAIAHELQHALEVLGDARVRTDADIFGFYKIRSLEVRGVSEVPPGLNYS